MKWARVVDDAFQMMAAANHVWKAFDEAGKKVSDRWAEGRRPVRPAKVTPIRRRHNGYPQEVSEAHIEFHNIVGRWPESEEELHSFMVEYYGGFD